MVNTYRLVNPSIRGDYKNKIKAKNSVEAAKILYTSLSEHFNNNLPEFCFTIQKGSSGKGKYYSFRTREVRKGEEVKFSIQPYSISNEKKAYKSLEKKLEKFNETMDGGRKKAKRKSKKAKKAESYDDSEDDLFDDDSEDYYVRASSYVPVLNYPIYHFWYDPSLYKLKSFYVPTFYSYVTPIIQVGI